MSLRFRVVLAIVLTLLAGCAVGLGSAGWRAREALREELAAALSSGRQAVTHASRDIGDAGSAAPVLERLARAFDGDRHLRLVIKRADGSVAAASQPPRAATSPDWFERLFDPQLSADTIGLPGASAAVRLEPMARVDVHDIWQEAVTLTLVLAASIGATAVLAWLTVGHALRPLDDVASALSRIGAGRYEGWVEPRGALELRRLTRGVNDMTGRLAAMQSRTQALERQLLTLQDEERADLARDLHDEMGPHLFAANVDASMARRLIAEQRPAEAGERVAAIQASVAILQRLVRDILARLKPAELIELGLSAAIAELAAFWRSRHPEVALEASCLIDDAMIDEAVRETLYRVVQEGLSNAFRHARPRRITVRIAAAKGWIEAQVSDDGRASGPAPREGFGLLGMRERLSAVGGDLEIRRLEGWTLIARAPLTAPVPDLVAAR